MVEYQLPKLGVAGSIPVARFFLLEPLRVFVAKIYKD